MNTPCRLCCTKKFNIFDILISMKKSVLAPILIVLLSFGASFVSAQDLSSSHFIIRDPSVGTGGGYQSSTNFKLNSVGNLNVSGNGGTSATFMGRDGFLQYPLVKAGVLSATTIGSAINTTWTATTVADGYTVSGYNIGISTTSGSGYTFTSLGNVLSYNYTGQVNGTYYLILQTLDAFGNVIATSNEVTAVVFDTIVFSISANNVSFGPLTPGGPRYATVSGGSNSLAAAHTISAASNDASGYTIFYTGTTLSSDGNTIPPATILGSPTGTPGTNQFALSLLSSGSASVPTTYDQTSQNWDFAQNTLATIASTSGPSAIATLNAYYLANAALLDAPGTYTTTVTYGITSNY